MRMITSAALACLLALTTAAADLGDPAKPLKIAEWVKGGPVDLSEGKGEKVYVVEFWATWCGPCRTSIPHLTELQEKYADKGVVFIGVSDEEASTVEPFVKDMGEEMDYVVAVDDGGATSEAYMQAYGQNGIPTAFVVDKQGRVAWVGHPMDRLDEVVAAVVDGSYDLEAELALAKRMEEVQERIEAFQMALVNGEEDAAHEKARAILAEYSDVAPALANTAWTLMQFEGLKNPDYKLAGKLAEAALEAEKEEIPDLHHIYARALFLQGDKAAAIVEQKKAIDLAREQDSQALSFFEEALAEYESGDVPEPAA